MLMNTQTRDLAPIITEATCEAFFRDALSGHQMAEFRRKGSRKHHAVDITSISAVVQVMDKLKPENKEKLIRISRSDPLNVALNVWKLIGRTKQ